MSTGIMIVGAGRVGSNLARHVRRMGLRLALVVEASAERRAALLDGISDVAISDSLPARLPDGVTHCALAVPDAEIAIAAGAIAGLPDLPPGLVVFHTSGSRSSELLAELATRGCVTGCLHPMQSFPAQPLAPERLDGIGCGVEGSDTFWDEASALASELGWKPLRIATERKALYHAANVFAGNFPVALALAAERLLRESSVDGSSASLDQLLPMLHTVVDRLDSLPSREALTGPAARGDRETIARHLAALEAVDPGLRAAYAAITEWLLADDG